MRMVNSESKSWSLALNNANTSYGLKKYLLQSPERNSILKISINWEVILYVHKALGVFITLI